jgi:hypothetical protein
MSRYLIVANQTLGGAELVAWIDRQLAAGPLSLFLAVPVTDTDGTPQWDYPPFDRLIADAQRVARTLAEGRMHHELARLRGLGVVADGQVVGANPVEHVKELARDEQFDGVLVSTLPHRLSRWLRMDLPHRLSRALSVSVTQIEGNAGPSL